MKNPNYVILGKKKKGKSYEKEILFQGIDEALRGYNKADVYIKMIHTDNGFCLIFNKLKDK